MTQISNKKKTFLLDILIHKLISRPTQIFTIQKSVVILPEKWEDYSSKIFKKLFLRGFYAFLFCCMFCYKGRVGPVLYRRTPEIGHCGILWPQLLVIIQSYIEYTLKIAAPYNPHYSVRLTTQSDSGKNIRRQTSAGPTPPTCSMRGCVSISTSSRRRNTPLVPWGGVSVYFVRYTLIGQSAVL